MFGQRILGRVAVGARPCARSLISRGKDVLLARSAGLSASAKASKSFLEAGQVDVGFWQGTAILGAAVTASQLVPFTAQLDSVKTVISGFRTLGLKAECISDEVLVKDFLRKNALAAQNVLIASPTFYFLFSYITGNSLAICCLRAITGTMRIVPFMGLFYGAFAVLAPFVTQSYMRAGGKSYTEAVSGANVALMLGGFVFVEAVVELRGCGVTFAQMTLSSFFVFVPALVGRLAAGVLTQQAKVGTESVPVVPTAWESGSDWQRRVHSVSKALCLDVDFLTTAAGTSVFQHILNAVTFVLLQRGRASTLGDIGRFLLFGVNNTIASGMAQTMRTFLMRTIFGLSWNMASSQAWETPVFDAAASQ